MVKLNLSIIILFVIFLFVVPAMAFDPLNPFDLPKSNEPVIDSDLIQPTNPIFFQYTDGLTLKTITDFNSIESSKTISEIIATKPNKLVYVEDGGGISLSRYTIKLLDTNGNSYSHVFGGEINVFTRVLIDTMIEQQKELAGFDTKITEQQATIDQQNQTINNQQEQINKLEERITALEKEVGI